MATSQLNTAMILVTEHRYAEAAPLLRQLHRAAPRDARINYSLGLVYSHFGELRKAVQHLASAAKVATQRDEVFTKLGEVYYYLQKPVMARQAYSRAIELAPQSPFGHLGLYRLEGSLGNTEAAEQHLDTAYKLDPKNPFVLLAIANNAKFQSNPEVLDEILAILDDPASKVAPEQRAELGFAAGKIFEKNGDLEKAFAHYGNYRTGMYRPYNLKLREWQVETIKKAFNEQFFEERKNFALTTERPVFVFGMPRSGTTLVEQIIGRHPKATGVGELTFFGSVQADLKQTEDISPRFFQAALNLDQKHAKRIGRKYLSELDIYDKKAARIIDKMPHNFEMLWLLALLYPRAKFVHVHREPADTCASIYTLALEATHNYNIDQETLGAYYGLYAEMMEHWDKVLPVKIHHQSYEALIADQETQSRALLDYVGLPWDPVCLDFQSSDRQVLTFSKEQVRQPIYTSSIGRWKKYEPYIQPLLQALGKYAPTQQS